MDFEFILVEKSCQVAVVSLNRPAHLNALNKCMVLELDHAFDLLAADPGVRAVVIAGDKNFAAGADVSGMKDLDPERAKEFSFRHTFNKIEQMPKPVIAAITGFALGGGLELALVCDIRVAAPDAKLGLPEINLGLFPGAGGTQRLPRLIGPSRAKQMIYSGSTIKAHKAWELGLVDIIAEDPFHEALKLAKTLASKAPIALRMAKQCIDLAQDMDLGAGVEFEALAWASLFATDDQKEGLSAFLEKRSPQFTGK